MAVYNIVKIGDPVLREKCRPVNRVNSNVIKLLENMADTMYEAQGVGLAAPQIGIVKRVVVIDVGEGLIEIINPEITYREGSEIDVEGCLSIPEAKEEIPRYKKVKVKGINRAGERVEYEAEGLLARAFQHEIDHLDGILFIDRVNEATKK